MSLSHAHFTIKSPEFIKSVNFYVYGSALWLKWFILFSLTYMDANLHIYNFILFLLFYVFNIFF